MAQTGMREREQHPTDDALQNLVAGTASVNGVEFFPALVRHLAIALGVRMAVVTECTDERPLRARQLARWKDGQPDSGLEYATENTPCSAVLHGGGLCFYPDHVQDQFPGNSFLVAFGASCYLGAPLFDGAGKTLGHLYVVDDKPLSDAHRAKSIISIFAARAAMELQRKRAEDQIREQAALLNKAHDAILVRDMDDTILFWNEGAERLYGWNVEEAIGRATAELLLKQGESPNTDEPWKVLLDQGDWSGELRHRTKEGKDIVVESRWTLVRDESGRPRSVLTINTDITEKKQLEINFLRAQRIESIGTLAGGVAHDLNNVLTPILLAVETLLSKPIDDTTRDLLTMIESNAKRGADMAHQVLTFARGAEGGRVLLDPRRLIKEVEVIVRATFPPSIRLHTSVPRGLRQVMGNATQLHQVLINLCVNARDAMPGGGILGITAENISLEEVSALTHPHAKPGTFVVIRVSDTGSGMPPDVMERVFEPFFTTKDIGKGTGLGLATATGIMKGHGGFVEVSSEVDKGSTFRVYLPVAEPQPDRRVEYRRRLPRGNGQLVLVVDDEGSIREMARKMLEDHGYRAITAQDGGEALALFARYGHEVKVVLTDMMMPFMDGPAMIRAIEQLDPMVQFIVSSGMTGNEDSAMTISNRVRGYLPKPYTAERLLTTLSSMLGASGMMERRADRSLDIILEGNNSDGL